MQRFLFISLVFMPFLQSCTVEETDNNQIVVSMIEAINDRDLAVLDHYVSKNIIRNSAATPGIIVTSIDEFREFLKADIASMPDSVQVIDVIFGSGDYAAVRATLTGTQTGPMDHLRPAVRKWSCPSWAFSDSKTEKLPRCGSSGTT